jgi:hypothetical protein
MTLPQPGACVTLPYWAMTDPLAAVVRAMTFARPQQWHFSLCTLLIATTVFAATLGLAVWLSK